MEFCKLSTYNKVQHLSKAPILKLLGCTLIWLLVDETCVCLRIYALHFNLALPLQLFTQTNKLSINRGVVMCDCVCVCVCMHMYTDAWSIYLLFLSPSKNGKRAAQVGQGKQDSPGQIKPCYSIELPTIPWSSHSTPSQFLREADKDFSGEVSKFNHGQIIVNLRQWDITIFNFPYILNFQWSI